MPGFQLFFVFFLHNFVLTKLATSSIMVKGGVYSLWSFSAFKDASSFIYEFAFIIHDSKVLYFIFPILCNFHNT